MIKKLIILGLVLLYMYHLLFGIFLNNYFRVPTPLLFGIPLIVIFRENLLRFNYFKELCWLVIANFLYYYFAQENSKEFFINSITIAICAMFFNYFVGSNKQRFHLVVGVFCFLLFMSTNVMFFNHLFRAEGNSLRNQLIGGEIVQSPSGITTAIYNFGYQLAPLVTFIFVAAFAFKKNFLIKVCVLLYCLIAIYFGMQRSVLFTFILTALMFLVAYYRAKAIPVIMVIGVIGIVISGFFLQETSGEYDNIFAKNERNADEDRSSLVTENLKIFTSYPYGLVFHGKKWSDVTRNNPVFGDGLTSHNAYLMFITYLGPFLALLLLTLIYYRHAAIFRNILGFIKDPENALLAALCFSFLAISLNSLFHNAWLVGANGPTVFLYFAIVNFYKQQREIDSGQDLGIVLNKNE